MNLEMVQVWVMLVLLVCLNSVAGKNRLIESNKALMRIVDHLHVEMESCSGMFFCGYFKGYGAHCIPRQQVCDGFNNCDGGEDEAFCPPKKQKCIGDQVMCPHINRCALLCNGIPECLSGIDERYCESKCKNGQVKCSDGKCAVVGDGKPECDDRADENCPVSPPCEKCEKCEQCGVGELSCILKTSGKRKCVSTCDTNIECVLEEDKIPLSTCPCPSGWMRFEASCYKIVMEDKNWFAAIRACIAMSPNARLVSVESEMENAFLTSKLLEVNGPNDDRQFWMGATDSAMEGVFVWQHSNQPVSVSFFAPNNPNNGGNEDCLAFWGKHGYLWNDASCPSNNPFICEIEQRPEVKQLCGKDD